MSHLQSRLNELCMSAGTDTTEITRLLDTTAVDLNFKASRGKTALETASGAGNLSTVNLLLSRGASPAVGQPLIEACRSGNKPIVQLLVSAGGTLNTDTPLITVLQGGHMDIADFLLVQGAGMPAQILHNLVGEQLAPRPWLPRALDWLKQQQGFNVNTLNTQGRTALWCASAERTTSAATMQALLAAGCDPRLRDPGSSLTALGAAVQICDAHAGLQSLLDSPHGCELLEAVPGVHPVLLSVKNGHLRSLKMMLSSSAFGQLPQDQKYTICTAVLWKGKSLQVLNTMCDSVDQNVVTTVITHRKDGETLLHGAVRDAKPLAVLCKLIKLGVPVHAVDNCGRTAVQLAVELNRGLLSQLLMSVTD